MNEFMKGNDFIWLDGEIQLYPLHNNGRSHDQMEYCQNEDKNKVESI